MLKRSSQDTATTEEKHDETSDVGSAHHDPSTHTPSYVLTSRYRHSHRLRRQALDEAVKDTYTGTLPPPGTRVATLTCRQLPSSTSLEEPKNNTKPKAHEENHRNNVRKQLTKKPNKIHLHLVKSFRNMHSERRGKIEEEEQNHTTMNKSDKAQNENSAAQERRRQKWKETRAHEELRVGYK
jgi:hypothetical protein